MVIANCVLCFPYGTDLGERANYRSCFSNFALVNSRLPSSSSKSTVVHYSSVQRHQTSLLRHLSLLRHSTVLHQSPVFHHSTVWHQSSVLHHSTVLYHSLSTILCHVIMLLYNSKSSTILLPMRIRIADYLTASLKS